MVMAMSIGLAPSFEITHEQAPPAYDELAAFNEAVVEHQAAVYRMCLRFLRSPEEAEDATQEAFLRAWRFRDRVDGPIRPWLFTIAANVCRSYLRKLATKRSSSLDLALDDGMPEPAQDEMLPDEVVLNSALRTTLVEALKHLPEDQRIALTLRDVDGLDYLEIATATHATMGTVKSRIARARMRMRELLSAEMAGR